LTRSEDSSSAAKEARRLREFIMSGRRRRSEVPVPEGILAIGVPAPSLGDGKDGEVHWFSDRHWPNFVFRVRWTDDGPVARAARR
jgi:hypothetical protein